MRPVKSALAAVLVLFLLALAGCAPEPEPLVFERAAAPSDQAAYGHGLELSASVYVSKSSHTIHRNPTCSGMKHYRVMPYGEALERGCSRCQSCFKEER